MRASPRTYTDAENAEIRSGLARGKSRQEIAHDMGRTYDGLLAQISRLRKAGKLPAFATRTVQRHQLDTVDASPPVSLRDDDTLVRECLAQGGFPRAVIISVGTVWADHHGRPWRHVLSNYKSAALSRSMALREMAA